MRDFRIYYMGDIEIIWNTIHADGFDVLKDGIIVFYQNNGGHKRNFAAYKEWLRVEER